MSEHARRALLEQAVAMAKLPAVFAQALCDEAPWLDGEHELSEELGPELLARPAADHRLTKDDVARFVREYNSLVSALLNPSQVRQSQAYVAFTDILASYGREGLLHADYWLPSDSFSTRHPVIILNRPGI